ncbi:hypothetical protein KNU57_gp82 [Gordonia phage Valary]|uniref:Uncharacterized protein n=2 Tax=Wizardvirus TaxID=2169658 RepID=A0A4Y5TZJ1_9CAUD|nr:hypothetical protein KNU56_gp81 [Gordonia phage Arri]YP_010102427.1 hypothetical protein KNU57_gp82 [Gordonia phage Valary]QDB74858.1 hypothetical protein SEA_ARRI_81 [Gordonia phage Arri]QDB74950.1 hypothetical protein SEA_VALARY_82 [Gordonia phage Valary]
MNWNEAIETGLIAITIACVFATFVLLFAAIDATRTTARRCIIAATCTTVLAVVAAALAAGLATP